MWVLWMAFSQGDGSGSVVVYWYGEYVDSCAPPQKSYIAVVVQDSHWVKAGLLQLNSTTPFIDTDAYVASSNVSLAGYICTHVCPFYVFAERRQSRQ